MPALLAAHDINVHLSASDGNPSIISVLVACGGITAAVAAIAAALIITSRARRERRLETVRGVLVDAAKLAALVSHQVVRVVNPRLNDSALRDRHKEDISDYRDQMTRITEMTGVMWLTVDEESDVVQAWMETSGALDHALLTPTPELGTTTRRSRLEGP